MKNFKKGLIYAGVLAFCIGFGAYIYCNSIKKKIPDKLYIYKQDKAVFSMDIPVVGTVYDSSNNICADNIDFGEANKVFIPFEATNTLSSLGAIKEVMKDDKKDKKND